MIYQDSISDIVKNISSFCLDRNIRNLFLLGDYCRHIYFDQKSEVSTLHFVYSQDEYLEDIVHVICSEVLLSPFKKDETRNIFIVRMESNNLSIKFESTKCSGYINNESVQMWVKKSNLDNILFANNICSMEFTFNALIYSLYNNSLYDVCGRSVRDIRRKIVDTIIPSSILFKNNPISLLRSIYFSLLFDFHISDNIIHSAKEITGDFIKSLLSNNVISDHIISALKLDTEGSIEMLKKMNMDDLLSNDNILNFLKDKHV